MSRPFYLMCHVYSELRYRYARAAFLFDKATNYRNTVFTLTGITVNKAPLIYTQPYCMVPVKQVCKSAGFFYGENMNIEKLKGILDLLDGLEDRPYVAEQESPVEIGESYLFRTVTHIEVGRVTKITGIFVTIEDASWIADTGRYHDCLKNGVFNEVEPYPISSTINLSSLINLAPWPHELPMEQK